jgi:DNA ligase-1
MNREFVLLAKPWDGVKDVSGWYASIKYDGQRCIWDGGVSRGKEKRTVPWANCNKDGRYKEVQIATGLWSRYGNVIHAPGWWLDKLPVGVVLDGELWEGRGLFQHTRSIVSSQTGWADWTCVRLMVVDIVSPSVLFTDGRINNPNWKEGVIRASDCLKWFEGVPRVMCRGLDRGISEIEELKNEIITPIKQVRLGRDYVGQLADMVMYETSLKGEGVVVRHPSYVWEPKRVGWLLKVKETLDAEGTVVGWEWGEGRLKGMLGALIVEGGGKTFRVSGFTDAERMVTFADGSYTIGWPIGSRIRYKFMGLTDAGLPREPRYWR